jgi:hypothetical protein
VLAQLPKEVVIDNTAKKGIVQWCTAFNQALIEFKQYKFADYRCGCGTPRENGIGSNPYGYHSCAPANGIDRVMGLNVRRKTLPADDDQDVRAPRQVLPVLRAFRRAKHFDGQARGQRDVEESVREIRPGKEAALEIVRGG